MSISDEIFSLVSIFSIFLPVGAINKPCGPGSN